MDQPIFILWHHLWDALICSSTQISPTSQASTKVFTHLSNIIFLSVFWGQINWLQEAQERKSGIQICWRELTCSLCDGGSYGSWGITVLALKASSLLLETPLFLSRLACEEMDPSTNWETETKAKTNLQTHNFLGILEMILGLTCQVRPGKLLRRFKLIVEGGRRRPWIHSVSGNIHRQSHVR